MPSFSHPRPRLARADRRERRMLADWLAQIVSDDDATDVLLDAYEAMPVARRREFVAFAERALSEAGHLPAPVLARLAAVEDDEELLFAIVARLGLPLLDAIAAHGDAEGGVVLRLGRTALRVSPGPPVRVHVEEDTAEDAASSLPVDEAIDRAAQMLWSFLRSGGALPEGASRFAHLFAP